MALLLRLNNPVTTSVRLAEQLKSPSRPLDNTEVDSNFQQLNASLFNHALKDSPVFTTSMKGPTSSNLIYTDTTFVASSPAGDDNIVTTEWFQTALNNLTTSIIPIIDLYDSGLTRNDGSTIYSGIDIGSSTKRFGNIHAGSGFFEKNTVVIGQATLSGTDQGGIVLPSNTALGSEDNVIPSNLASTFLDKVYSASNNTSVLEVDFEIEGAAVDLPPFFVYGLTNGKVAPLTPTQPFNDKLVGAATAQDVDTGTLTVAISGVVDGFTGLITGSEYFLTTQGVLTLTSATTTVKVGTALSATSLFLYSDSTLDIYGLTKTKIQLKDLSAGTNAAPSGEGGLSYNNTTGEFILTPTKSITDAELIGTPTATTPDVTDSSTQIATTSFVAQKIAELINSAPGTLDTLKEISDAIGADANFTQTVFNSIGTKANIASATLTGSPSAPTPPTGTNNTQLATTEFVNSALGSSASLDSPSLTGTPTTPLATVGAATAQIASTAFVARAVAQGGGASNMDGGVAATVRTIATHHFDGGGA
jgi:hypothetical protein